MTCVDCDELIKHYDPIVPCVDCGGTMHVECAMLDADGDPRCEVHFDEFTAVMEITDEELNRLTRHEEHCNCRECACSP
jgi:hypothetical protein